MEPLHGEALRPESPPVAQHSCPLLTVYPHCKRSAALTHDCGADSFGTTGLPPSFSYYSRDTKTHISLKNALQTPGLVVRMDLCASVMRDLGKIFIAFISSLFQSSLRA